MLSGKNILVGITGGISAYKICTLIRLYKKAGANVRVVVTPNALKFVTKLTLQTLSCNDVFEEQFNIDEYKPEHIALADSDIFVIAPATANTIGKIANGICDNLLTTTVCAFKNPVLIVPAMNNNMWENQFVKENVLKLKNAGYEILSPSSGELACGVNAVGRMREPEDIFEKTAEILNGCNNKKTSLTGKKVLITAGGTKEKIDPVRYITNNSSGKMGVALANSASKMGAYVTLISTFKSDGYYKNIVAETAIEMEKAVKDELDNKDVLIMAAAVADYKAANYSEQKIKKTDSDKIYIELVKNPDILKDVSIMCENKPSKPIIIGFCAESENLIENAKTKILKKGCDYIVANDISRKDIGFESDKNEVFIIDKNLNIKHIDKDTKENIAQKILETIFE